MVESAGGTLASPSGFDITSAAPISTHPSTHSETSSVPPPSAATQAPTSTAVPSESPTPQVICGDHVITYDGLEPTIETQATAPGVFVADVISADAFLLPIGSDGSGESAGVTDVYRLLTVDVTAVAKGDDEATMRDIAVPGGTFGCATFLVSGLPELTQGERYAFFVEERTVQVPEGSAPVTFTLWPVSSGGIVKTPLDGDLTIDEFVSAVRAAGT